MAGGDPWAERKLKRQIREGARATRGVEKVEALVRLVLATDAAVLSGEAGSVAGLYHIAGRNSLGPFRASVEFGSAPIEPVTLAVLEAVARATNIGPFDHFRGKGHGPRDTILDHIEVGIALPESATLRASAIARLKAERRGNAEAVAAWLRNNRSRPLAARYLKAIEGGDP